MPRNCDLDQQKEALHLLRMIFIINEHETQDDKKDWQVTPQFEKITF